MNINPYHLNHLLPQNNETKELKTNVGNLGKSQKAEAISDTPIIQEAYKVDINTTMQFDRTGVQQLNITLMELFKAEKVIIDNKNLATEILIDNKIDMDNFFIDSSKEHQDFFLGINKIDNPNQIKERLSDFDKNEIAIYLYSDIKQFEKVLGEIKDEKSNLLNIGLNNIENERSEESKKYNYQNDIDKMKVSNIREAQTNVSSNNTYVLLTV